MFAKDYFDAMFHADQKAFVCGFKNVNIFHVMFGTLFIKNHSAILILKEYGVTYEWFSANLCKLFNKPVIHIDLNREMLPLTKTSELVLKTALKLAKEIDEKLDLNHVVLAILQTPSPVLTLIKNALGDDNFTSLLYRIAKINDNIFKHFTNNFINQVTIE